MVIGQAFHLVRFYVVIAATDNITSHIINHHVFDKVPSLWAMSFEQSHFVYFGKNIPCKILYVPWAVEQPKFKWSIQESISKIRKTFVFFDS